jgi:hypothetical protein
MPGIAGIAQSVLNYGRGMVRSPFAYRTGWGAAAGGIYGGISNDTSVLGGAAMGAGLARYGGSGIWSARQSWNTLGRGTNRLSRFGWNMLGGGVAAGSGAATHAIMEGVAAGMFIGKTAGRAVNGFRGLRNTARARYTSWQAARGGHVWVPPAPPQRRLLGPMS